MTLNGYEAYAKSWLTEISGKTLAERHYKSLALILQREFDAGVMTAQNYIKDALGIDEYKISQS